MTVSIIILAACLVPALVVGSVLLWVAMNAILHGRGIIRDVASAMGLGQALRSTYDDTVRQSLPEDFLDLLGRLTEHKQRMAKT